MLCERRKLQLEYSCVLLLLWEEPAAKGILALKFDCVLTLRYNVFNNTHEKIT